MFARTFIDTSRSQAPIVTIAGESDIDGLVVARMLDDDRLYLTHPDFLLTIERSGACWPSNSA